MGFPQGALAVLLICLSSWSSLQAHQHQGNLQGLSWYDLPSPSLPTSGCLQAFPPLLCPFCLHSAPTLNMLAQLMQLHHTHSQTNCGSTPDLFRPGSHAKGHHLYTLSTFILFA